jgi:hypothetical protein
MKRSERIRSSEDKAVRLKEIDAHVLDLLVDGESSFAALFFGLRRHWVHTEVDVDEVLDVLQRLEDLQLVHARQMDRDGTFRELIATDYERASREYCQWLPQATASEVSVDEIGLWYQLTERGREAWSQWSGGNEEYHERWMLDDRADQKILEVRADRRDVAEAALDRWLAEHDEMLEVSGTREFAQIPEFVMRDGTRVRDGVLVTCRYHRRPSSTRNT